MGCKVKIGLGNWKKGLLGECLYICVCVQVMIYYIDKWDIIYVYMYMCVCIKVGIKRKKKEKMRKSSRF